MKRLATICTSLLAVLIVGYTVPIVTETLPPDVWAETDFEQIKLQIEEAWEEHNKLTSELIDLGYVSQRSFTVVAKYGHTNVRRTLLGSRESGSSDEAIWTSKPWIRVSRPGFPDPWGGKDSKSQVAPLVFEAYMAYLEKLTADLKADLKDAKQNKTALADRSPGWSFRSQL